MSVIRYIVPFIPDCTEYKYYTLVSDTNARSDVFQMWISLLQIISRFDPGTISLSLRAVFKPDARRLQERLCWSLVVRYSEDIDEKTVESLMQQGPIGAYYTLIRTSNEEESYEKFKAAAEITRCEETSEPQVPVEYNENIKHVGLYYAVHPFIPKEQNDHLLIDRILSQVSEEVIFEFMVEPLDEKPIRDILTKYINNMIAINQGSNDVFLEGVSLDGIKGSLGHDEEDFSYDRKTFKSDYLVDEYLFPLQELLKVLREPHLRFDFRVLAESRQISTLVATTIAEAGLSEGHYQLLAHDHDSEWFDALKSSMIEGTGFSKSYSSDWFTKEPGGAWELLRLLARAAPVSQLSGFVNLPVAAEGSPRCMYKSSDPGADEHAEKLKSREKQDPGQKTVTAKTILIGRDLEMGIPEKDSQYDEDSIKKVYDPDESGMPMATVPLKLFNKHFFIAGVPGSGKTVAVFNLLVQLHKNEVPFLVIEPAKTEYRILKAIDEHWDPQVRRLNRELRVYTPGNEKISPFRFNPLAFSEDDVSLDEHIDSLLRSFKAGMEMWGPMEAIIGEALEITYSNHGGNSFPNLSDLVNEIRLVVDNKGYKGEILSNITAAIETRIAALTRRSVGQVFSQSNCFPSIDELLSYPTVIEMDHMGTENACLLTMFLLSAMREKIKMRDSGCPLQHVTVIEEAHNIVCSSSPESAGEGQLKSKAYAAEYVTRMLAELRALGEGIVIVDQLPTAVAPSVIKNTATKLALRQVSQDDRELLGGTMLLGGKQVEELARLHVGEGFYYSESLHAPRRVKCINCYDYLQLSDKMYPAGKSLIEYVSTEKWYQDVMCSQLDHISRGYRKYLELLREVYYLAESIHDIIEEGCYSRGSEEADEILESWAQRIKENLKNLEYEFKIVDKLHENLKERVHFCGEELAGDKLLTLDKAVEDVYKDISRTLDFCYSTLNKINELRKSE